MSAPENNETISETITVLVLGGSGFVGRHAVASLILNDVNVIIGTRTPGHINSKLPTTASSSEQRQIQMESLLIDADWTELIEDADVVLNCVGILRQRGQSTYDKVHHLAPGALAKACADVGKRLVHVTALGLHAAARSRFLTSKLRGEGAIKATDADWIIVRPSLLDGVGGFGARWLRGVAQLPFFFAPTNANGHIAALHVEDLGQALARLCIASAPDLKLDTSREFELGGEQTYTFKEYIRTLRRRYTDKSSLCVPVPALAARLFAHACDVVHFSPFSFGHWELLARDNKPEQNRLAELLQRPPREIS
jgi:uncharacterized protein YbjT (DUF2867 family)